MQQVPYKLVETPDLKFADIASAATVNLDAAVGNYGQITGTTTITAITLSEGKSVWVRFTGALTLTHGASLVLLDAANRVTVAGDWALFAKIGAVVYMVEYVEAVRTVVGATAACTGALTTNSSWELVRAGKVVTLRLPATIGAIASATPAFTFGTAVPAEHRPKSGGVFALCRTLDNGSTYQVGHVSVSETTGVIQVVKEVTSSVNFTAATVGGLNAVTVISWLVA